MDIKETGVYWNPDKCQHEAWAVNQKTGEKTLLGAYSIPHSFPKRWKKIARKEWEAKIWARFFFGGNGAKTEGGKHGHS